MSLQFYCIVMVSILIVMGIFHYKMNKNEKNKTKPRRN